MIIYILKFSACLALFLAFYKLVLEKENMHVFKRFYLLGALLLSIGIPLITFTYYVEPSIEIIPQITQNILSDNTISEFQPQTNYLPIILMFIYSMGVILFGYKFIKNLYNLNYKIKHNPKQKNNRITNVLLKDLIIPHTFFNYIFFNKQKFETHQIPKEVFWHEETHAIQKHSIDVLFIEILQIVFWFNPLVYFIKHVVKLNHEFLADQAVLKKGVETATYQETLLAFSSPDSYRDVKTHQLANAINYSSIKKRFTVMKTKTSKKGIWLRSLVLLPLLAIMLYGFSTTQILEKDIRTEANPSLQGEIIDFLNTQPKDIWVNIMKDGSLNLNEIGRISLANLEENLEKLNSHLDLTFDERQEKIYAIIQIDYDTDLKTLLEVKEKLTAYGVKIIIIKESVWENTNPDNPSRITEKYTRKTPEKIAKFKIDGEIMDVIDITLDNLGTKNINGETIYYITADGITTYWDEHRTPVDENGIEIKVNTEKQQKATKEQIAEYNAIVKKLNSQPENMRIIKQKDVVRIKYIFGLMNAGQKKNALPFPKLVPSPPPVMDTLYTYNRLAKRVQTISKNRKANVIYLKKIYSEMSEAKKSQVSSPETILKKVPPAPEVPKAKQPDLPPPPPLPKNATLDWKVPFTKPTKLYKIKAPQKNGRILLVTEEYAKNHPEDVIELSMKDFDFIPLEKEFELINPAPSVLSKNETKEQKRKYKEGYKDAQVAAKVLRLKAQKGELVKVRELRSVEDRERLKTERLANRETQVAAKVLKLKAQKEKLVKVREVRLKEDKKRLKEEKKAYKKSQEGAKAKKEQLAKIQEVINQESISSSQEKERMKKITQAYAKKHPESVTKHKSSKGELIEVVEMPMDAIGSIYIYGENYKYLIKDGKMIYYDKNGKILTQEDINKLPPPFNWPLKHVTEMTKKNAIFFLDGKKIDSKKAIQLLKDNQKISVATEGVNSENPKVFLYTKKQ